MKKSFSLSGRDCAHCAQKMENAIRKIDGVSDVQVSFLMQKLTLSADSAVFDSVLAQTVKLCRKIEPDCEINV